MSALTTAAPLPQHFAELHGYEQALVLLLAFGPFLVLGVVVYVARRRDLSEEHTDEPPVH